MKLKNIFFALLFLTNLTALHSQNGIITYKTKRTKIRKTSNPEMTRKITEEVNRSSYVLYFNKEKSFFKKVKNIPLYPFESKFADISTGANKNWYQFNGINKEAMYNTEILSKQYIINDSSRMKEWELFNEIKIIDGYTCYKAVNKN
ncbi:MULTISPECIES: GLPGLI family protein [Polaribacter]|uniref:GLPGLI family protein n=1 Tax=Polaribacter marinaquae TaxID=1642819 RepID=A0ABZ2TTL2_9FLAO